MKSMKFTMLIALLAGLFQVQELTAQIAGQVINFHFNRYNSASDGSKVSVKDGENLGTMQWKGWTPGEEYQASAGISIDITGEPLDGYLPSRMSFFTGGFDLIERMTILENGNIGIGLSNPLTRLHVNGDLTVDGDFNLNGDLIAENVIANQNVEAGQDVKAGNDVTAGQDVTAGNNVSATNDLTAGQNVTAGNDVSATNNVKAGQDVTAGNNVTATNNVNAGQDLTAGNDVSATNNVKAGQDVTAGNDVTATNNVNAGQNLTAGNNVSATNDLTAGQNVTAGNDVSATNNVSAGQDVTAGNNVSATNDLAAGQNVTAGNDVSATNNVSAGQDLTAGNNVTATNDVVAGNNVTVGNDLTVANDIFANGRVGIGIPDSNMPAGYMLYVSDGILAEKVKVALKSSSDWADYVFEEGYPLRPLNEVESFIKENGHLPGVPSAQDVVTQGIDVAKMDALLLEKIEELTLYILTLKKENETMRKELDELKNANR
jgi:predicted acyltransferase (DUF342 family)